jgi:hypothetical protein
VARARTTSPGYGTRPAWRIASLQGLILVLFLSYIIGNIFYVFPSGNPQPSDFIMTIVMGSVVTGLAFKIRESQRLVVLLALLLFWIWQINLVHYMFHSDSHFLWTNAYFLYNMGVFLAVSTLFQYFGATFIHSVRITLLVALIVEVTAVIVVSHYLAPSEPGLYRSIGTYQDPNQLAYWAILAFCSLLVLKPQKRLGGVELAGLAATIYIVVSSLSRSGTLALAIVLLVMLPGLRVKATWIALLACAAALAIVLWWSHMREVGAYLEQGAPAQILSRFDESDRDDNLAGRGYERLWRFPEHLILGAGEGAYWRFRGGVAYEQTEFHSSFGSILFSYGIVGLGLFGCFLWEVFRRAPLQHIAYLLGPLVWGLFNYGFRFSMFWVFLAIVYGMSTLRARSSGDDGPVATSQDRGSARP